MSIIDGFPATSFDAKDRAWVKEVAGASGLPDTTGASQGDVLAIGSDGPEWAAPSGGGGNDDIFILHVAFDDETGGESEETVAEVLNAIATGKCIIVALTYSNMSGENIYRGGNVVLDQVYYDNEYSFGWYAIITETHVDPYAVVYQAFLSTAVANNDIETAHFEFLYENCANRALNFPTN